MVVCKLYFVFLLFDLSGYLCSLQLLNRIFFNSLLCICSTVAGVLVELNTLSTLGTAVECGGLLYNIRVSTLGDDVVSFGVWIGIGSIRVNFVARAAIALRTGSPADNFGVVVEGGSIKIEIISLAACFRKSSSFTSGKGILCGKKSRYHSLLVFLFLESNS